MSEKLSTLNVKQNLVSVPVEELPERVQKWVQMYALSVNNGYDVLMEAYPPAGGNLVYGPRDLLPVIAMLDEGRKVYKLDFPARPGQDGSDIPLYEEILLLAMDGNDRDEETCRVIINIQHKLIGPLLARIIHLSKYGDSDRVREMRGYVLDAKFAACTIWREGKLRKDASK